MYTATPLCDSAKLFTVNKIVSESTLDTRRSSVPTLIYCPAVIDVKNVVPLPVTLLVPTLTLAVPAISVCVKLFIFRFSGITLTRSRSIYGVIYLLLVLSVDCIFNEGVAPVLT